MLLRFLLFISVASLFSQHIEGDEVNEESYKEKFIENNVKHPEDAGTTKSTRGIPGKGIIKIFLNIFKAIQKLNPFRFIFKIFGSHKPSGGLKTKIVKSLEIYPGTKWCGAGDKAKNASDLGKHFETDACCRKHDYCPDYVDPGETKYGLKNTGLFRRSSCDCDKMFYTCLKEVNSSTSKQIGVTYFNIGKPQCFMKVPCKESKKCSKSGKHGDVYAFFVNPKF